MQVLLQLLNVPLEESVVHCESDPLDLPACATNIPSRLTPLWIGPLPTPGRAPCGPGQTELCHHLGIAIPSQPRHPTLRWRHKALWSVQWPRIEDSLHFIHAGAVLGGRPQTVPDCSRHFLSKVKIGSEPLPIDGWLFTLITGRMRANRPSSFTRAATVLWSEVGLRRLARAFWLSAL